MQTGAIVAWSLDHWHRWSIQILVLFSLGWQIALFLFAGIRRRGAYPFRRFLLWVAYLLADYTATYALGHLSLTGALREQAIVAFWAPFLLLHLGGPDNISAYSLEDNKLWTRHLLNAVLQMIGAAYVLYEHIAAKGALLGFASILMFVVGAVKYGERTVALMRGNLDTIRRSVEKQPAAMHGHFHPQDTVKKDDGEFDEESLVRRAHSLFYICKRAIVDYPLMRDDSHGQDSTKMIVQIGLWQLMDTELSLMYDMLYTKAAVIHTCFGYLVRLISPLAIVASLLLFIFIDKESHGGVDVNITYILYGGALFMEMASLLNALGSSWTFAFLSTTSWHWLRYAALCNKRWDRLRRVVAYLHHLVRVGRGSRYRSRSWSCTMGQYNMLHYCTGSNSALTRPLLGSLAKGVGLGLNEFWNREHYSWEVDMPGHLKDSIARYMQDTYSKGSMNSLGILKNKWGKETLSRNKLFDARLTYSLGAEFHECIIIWHIGTEVFLANSEQAKGKGVRDDVEAIKVISNYMMFLLVKQPDMLPGFPQNRLYQLTCESLVKTWGSTERPQNMNLCATLKNLFRLHDDPKSDLRASDREKLAEEIYDEYGGKGFTYDSPRISYVTDLAKELLEMEEDGRVESVPKLVLEVWTDILVYACNKCTRRFHAEKLNSGGELTTVLWLMAEHFYQLSATEQIKSSRMEKMM